MQVLEYGGIFAVAMLLLDAIRDRKEVAEYLESGRGHEIAKTLLGLWKELQQATIGSKTVQEKDQLKRKHETWRLGILMQTALATVVIVSAVALA
jgi:hypothetical protein